MASSSSNSHLIILAFTCFASGLTLAAGAAYLYIANYGLPQPKQDLHDEQREDNHAKPTYEESEKEVKNNTETIADPEKEKKFQIPLRIVYASATGTAKEFAQSLQKSIFTLNMSGYHFDTSIVDVADYDQDNLELETIVVFLVSTWTGGLPPNSALQFYSWLEDMVLDFRVSKQWLSKVQFAIFGLGSSVYDEMYCKAAIALETKLDKLGAKIICPRGSGDDTTDIMEQFESWTQSLMASICTLYSTSQQVKSMKKGPKEKKREYLSLKEYRRQKKQKKEEEALRKEMALKDTLTEEDLVNEQMLEDYEEEEDNGVTSNEDGDVDVEDLGGLMKRSEKINSSTEMVTPMQRKALTKEGYKIIGTHSAVKLCRWTKHQLRGRGGCYKHTFYGITSYQCMETTPSLACANKCVFCWRHHKNPVGREWRWKVDEPQMLVEGAIERHQKMIKELKGMPGLIMSRWEEGFTVRHCALSLVGEPIMYPHINKFLDELHQRKISSFLVTNAQFPEKIAALEPVTQLYVSIDAATKESLKEVDRPLFKDFWERYIACLKALKEKGQRTVYRLTLVKSYNMEEVKEYCELIQLGEPDLIEIKAVTYCGKSDGSNLTMENVPWHEEVRQFAGQICKQMNGIYGLASEHEHSNSVLLAKKKFFIDNKWHTWINYEKFHELIKAYKNNGTKFTTDDYISPTPSWALYDAPEKGFDPEETRFRRSKDGKKAEIDV